MARVIELRCRPDLSSIFVATLQWKAGMGSMLLFICPSAIMQSKIPSYRSIGEASLAQCYDLHIYTWLAVSRFHI